MSRSLSSPPVPLRFPRLVPSRVAVVLGLLVLVLAWGYATRHRASRGAYGTPYGLRYGIPDHDASASGGEGAAVAAAAGTPSAAPLAMRQLQMPAAPMALKSTVDADAVADRQPDGDVAPSVPDPSAMLIRSGTASIRVDSLVVAMARVRAIAEHEGGFIANSAQETGSDAVRSATLEIKVPAANFEHLVADLAPLGAVETVNVTAEDVGEEYVDVEARVANARRLETRLVDLLATRTGKLTDVLDVERELARVRETIERYEGRLRYLRARSAMSTLSLTVHEPAPVLERPGTHPLADAVRQAWQNAVDVVATGIGAAGALVPLAIVVALAWGLFRLLRRGARAGRVPVVPV